MNQNRADEPKPSEVRPENDHEHPVHELGDCDLPLRPVHLLDGGVVAQEGLSRVAVGNPANVLHWEDVDHREDYCQGQDLVVVRLVQDFELTGEVLWDRRASGV